jgi:ribonuclease P protein component
MNDNKKIFIKKIKQLSAINNNDLELSLKKNKNKLFAIELSNGIRYCIFHIKVKKKIYKSSVIRNRLKRLIREVLRKNFFNYKKINIKMIQQIEYYIISYEDIFDISYQDLSPVLMNVIKSI